MAKANSSGHAKKIGGCKVETAFFVPVTALVPEDWKGWFFDAISEDAPFSWGDNNRTLITAERFRSHCVDVLDGRDELEGDDEGKEKFLDNLESMGQTYIDLEN